MVHDIYIIVQTGNFYMDKYIFTYENFDTYIFTFILSWIALYKQNILKLLPYFNLNVIIFIYFLFFSVNTYIIFFIHTYKLHISKNISFANNLRVKILKYNLFFIQKLIKTSSMWNIIFNLFIMWQRACALS